MAGATGADLELLKAALLLEQVAPILRITQEKEKVLVLVDRDWETKSMTK